MMGPAAFAEMWERFIPNVRAYALRHVGAVHAEDVVSETFLVAWRRRHILPPDQLPWLLVTARNVVRNQQRGLRRNDQLEAALRRLAHVARAAPAADVVAEAREEVLMALARLSEREREALLLTVWDGLTPRDAAKVSDCSVTAFNVRLHRARAHLMALIESTPQPLAQHAILRSTP